MTKVGKVISHMLKTIPHNYYVYGGMALNLIMPDIHTTDWDVVIDTNPIFIGDVVTFLKRYFSNVKYTTKNAIIENKYHTVYEISINDKAYMDIQFKHITEKISIVNGLRILSLDGLYKNIIDTINQNTNTVNEFNKMIQNKNELIVKSINQQIKDQIELIKSLEEENEDKQEINEEKQILHYLQSQAYFKKSVKELNKINKLAYSDYKKAASVAHKNNERLITVLKHLQNPNKFRSSYVKYLCNECTKGGVQLINCNDISC